MFKEAEIRTFIRRHHAYFETSAQQSCDRRLAVPGDRWQPGAYGTGRHRHLGRAQGRGHFTAPRGMLTVLLMRMQETDTSDESIRDLVGEVANTISGKCAPRLRQEFVISVRGGIAHDEEKVTTPHTRSFVIPIQLAHALRQSGGLPRMAQEKPIQTSGHRHQSQAARVSRAAGRAPKPRPPWQLVD